jgi:hypothetical protein
MNDIAPQMYDDIMARFEYYKKNNHTIERCEKKLANRTATYRDAYYYATSVGSCMADAFADVITQDKLPDGHMYYNIAQRTVRPALEHVGELCGLYSDGVQMIMNEEQGIGLKPVENVYTN